VEGRESILFVQGGGVVLWLELTIEMERRSGAFEAW
jgi:hypothetical protein